MSAAPDDGTGPGPRRSAKPHKLRKTGNRDTRIWLAPVLIAARETQTRAIGVRRFVYLIIDPPPGDAGDRLRELVTKTNAKGRLGLLPDPVTDEIAADAKAKAENAITDTLSDMREQGFFHPHWLLDNRSESRLVDSYDDLDEWVEVTKRHAENFAFDRQAGQWDRYEAWTEAADTMADIRAVCEPFGVSVYSSSGQMTVGALDRLGRRIVADMLARPMEGRPGIYLSRKTFVIYVGDCDPPGMQMPDKIKQAAVWANRWWHYHLIGEWYPDESAAEAWLEACEMVGDDPGQFEVEVVRVAVTFDDLDTSAATSQVSPSVAEQYAQWWPEDETRTLQLEGLSIVEVAQRVEDALTDRFDQPALDAVKNAEGEAHQEAVRRLETTLDDEDDDEATPAPEDDVDGEA